MSGGAKGGSSHVAKARHSLEWRCLLSLLPLPRAGNYVQLAVTAAAAVRLSPVEAAAAAVPTAVGDALSHDINQGMDVGDRPVCPGGHALSQHLQWCQDEACNAGTS